jgi:uncharacterized protein (TIGR03000 family)
MHTMTRLALGLLLLAGLATRGAAQDKAATTVNILVPERGHSETVVKVNGKTVEGEGDKRVYKATLAKDKETILKVEALVVPNNYTEITRFKEVKVKGGDTVSVDLTVKDTKTDKIVVRFVPTPGDIVDAMAKLAKMTKDDVVYDLGCGDAVMLIRPIMQNMAKRGVGVEYDPKVMKLAIENIKKNKLEDKIEIRQGDMLKLTAKDVADASVVLLYIGDDLGERVGPLLQKALKPGARIVSHRFTLGDWTPAKTVTVKGEDGSEYELHLWIVPEQKIEKR